MRAMSKRPVVPIRGLLEAHLAVGNLDRSIAFYRNVLGLPLAHGLSRDFLVTKRMVLRSLLPAPPGTDRPAQIATAQIARHESLRRGRPLPAPFATRDGP
jgi:catechol 2,3-dioxygenase-like lactoylglutathione lyase family enzyme